MEDLKPCPFCGSAEVQAIYETDDGYSYWGVHCKRCPGQIETDFLNDKDGAIKAWNRRP